MTNLEASPVTRRASALVKGRRIVVTLRQDDVIEMRLERLKDTVKISIPELFAELSRHGAAQAETNIPARKR